MNGIDHSTAGVTGDLSAIAIMEPASSDLAPIVSGWADLCERTGQPPSAAITDADLEALDESQQWEALRVGVIRLVNDELHRRRGGRGEDETAADGIGPRRRPLHAAQGRNPHVWRSLGLTLCGADGTLKELLRFGVEDLEKLATDSEVNRAAWARRKNWAREALAALKAAGRTALAELPAETLADLDQKAGAAWGR